MVSQMAPKSFNFVRFASIIALGEKQQVLFDSTVYEDRVCNFLSKTD